MFFKNLNNHKSIITVSQLSHKTHNILSYSFRIFSSCYRYVGEKQYACLYGGTFSVFALYIEREKNVSKETYLGPSILPRLFSLVYRHHANIPDIAAAVSSRQYTCVTPNNAFRRRKSSPLIS